MKRLTEHIILLPIILIIGCVQNSRTLSGYTNLNYDTSRITILNWDTSNSEFPGNSGAIQLSQPDINLTDSLLTIAVDNFNNHQKSQISKLFKSFTGLPADTSLFMIDLRHYRFEYAPYQDNNERRLISINCFCDDSKSSEKYKVVWGYKNYCHFRLTVDLKQRSSSEISVDYMFG
ncbi:MAG: hypothetical protein JSU05_11625 [Bacteroidetes bacterium]|nr:hypothetical protein [Bacteroidota bacterium]